MDVTFGQGSCNLVELFRRESDGARLDDLGLAAATEGNVEVRCGEAKLPIPGFGENVGEDWNGVLPLDDPLGELKLPNEVALLDEDFHGRVAPRYLVID